MNQIVMLRPIDEALDERLELDEIELPCPYCRVIAARRRFRNVCGADSERALHRFICSDCDWYLEVEEGSDLSCRLVISAITDSSLPGKALSGRWILLDP